MKQRTNSCLKLSKNCIGIREMNKKWNIHLTHSKIWIYSMYFITFPPWTQFQSNIESFQHHDFSLNSLWSIISESRMKTQSDSSKINSLHCICTIQQMILKKLFWMYGLRLSVIERSERFHGKNQMKVTSACSTPTTSNSMIKKIPKQDFMKLRQEVKAKLEKLWHKIQRWQVVFYMTADKKQFKFIF